MAHALGYEKLMKLVSTDIMPTPATEGLTKRTFAEMKSVNVIGVGVGGATTNVHSVFDGRFLRTVSANLGMSYSIGNVLKEAGLENIKRWVPLDLTDEMVGIVYNKMIRPTTIPVSLEDLVVEHAVARESIRMAFNHHKYLARELKGVKKERTILDIFEEVKAEETYIDMRRVEYIIGTGGLLSRAPRRAQSTIILTDAFQPVGFTYIMQGSVFVIPHLGVLSKMYKEIALEIFEKECLVPLGTLIAAAGIRTPREKVADVTIEYSEGESEKLELVYGGIVKMPIPQYREVAVTVEPTKKFDFGLGFGKRVKKRVRGGVVGVVLDGRGRPLYIPQDPGERRKLLTSWFGALELYPGDFLAELG